MRKFKIAIIITFIFILLFTLTGCGYGEEKGEIVDKHYIPAHTTTTYTFVDKIMIPITTYHSESWGIKIQKEENGKVKTKWISVPEEYYNQIEIGDFYNE